MALIEYGISNVYYANYTVALGVVTFDTPKPLPNAISLDLEAVGEISKTYADNMCVYVATSGNRGYDGTLVTTGIGKDFMVDCLGEKFDEVNGIITEVANAQSKPFALLFETQSDVKPVRHVMYNCIATRPKFSTKTTEESTETNTVELTFSSTPIIINGETLVKRKTYEDTLAATFNGWFNNVYIPTVTP